MCVGGYFKENVIDPMLYYLYNPAREPDFQISLTENISQ